MAFVFPYLGSAALTEPVTKLLADRVGSDASQFEGCQTARVETEQRGPSSHPLASHPSPPFRSSHRTTRRVVTVASAPVATAAILRTTAVTVLRVAPPFSTSLLSRDSALRRAAVFAFNLSRSPREPLLREPSCFELRLVASVVGPRPSNPARHLCPVRRRFPLHDRRANPVARVEPIGRVDRSTFASNDGKRSSLSRPSAVSVDSKTADTATLSPYQPGNNGPCL
ncbi:hypothetical protein SAMN04487948_13219 [Halogranum amylolyticum]|uniref:Uncharacterized protein n=1 Tax=Halogranum amylolyticum TaxID=660520 RepID=A0A1H8WKP8_9EURY|nr:hypothetical protein SAMN04487948_13219 [Halogranum amylolyticum]